jgi:hypothetical protein
MRLTVQVPITLCAGIGAILVALPASAYIGPGAGLTAIGTVIALVGGILLAIVGFVWYPIKRVLRSRARGKGDAATASLAVPQSADRPELAAKERP